jgi:hypothetical protein
MKKIKLLSLSALFLATACHKKTLLPETAIADPVFYLDAKVNGVPVNIQAGEAGYFMHSSVLQDSNDIYVFKGDLNGTCASTCGYSLSVLINDNKVSEQGARTQVDGAIQTGLYNLLHTSAFPTEQDLSFVPREGYSSTNSYSWQIVTEKGVVATSTSYSFTTSLKLATQYTVNYQFEDASGVCSGAHSNVYRPGSAFRTWMNMNKNGSEVKLTAFTDEPGIYTYLWELGDGTTVTGKEIQHQYNKQDKYRVKLTTTDAKNNTSVCYYQINTNPAGCESNFHAKYSSIDYSKVLRTITFILRDPSGATYSSLDAPLVNGSFAEILSVEDYQPNASGQATKKIKLRFNCKLKGDTGDVQIEDATAVIAVAY